MRENLGLQVAVIIFASLTVVLSVSTYVHPAKRRPAVPTAPPTQRF